MNTYAGYGTCHTGNLPSDAFAAKHLRAGCFLEDLGTSGQADKPRTTCDAATASADSTLLGHFSVAEHYKATPHSSIAILRNKFAELTRGFVLLSPRCLQATATTSRSVCQQTPSEHLTATIEISIFLDDNVKALCRWRHHRTCRPCGKNAPSSDDVVGNSAGASGS